MFRSKVLSSHFREEHHGTSENSVKCPKDSRQMSQFSQKVGRLQLWDNYWLLMCLSSVVKIKYNYHIYILN